MPSKSKSQQRLMGAAEHGATFPLARKLRASMTHQQLHDFASGSEKGKPDRVKRGLSSGTPSGAVSHKIRPISAPKTLAGRRTASHTKAYGG